MESYATWSEDSYWTVVTDQYLPTYQEQIFTAYANVNPQVLGRTSDGLFWTGTTEKGPIMGVSWQKSYGCHFTILLHGWADESQTTYSYYDINNEQQSFTVKGEGEPDEEVQPESRSYAEDDKWIIEYLDPYGAVIEMLTFWPAENGWEYLTTDTLQGSEIVERSVSRAKEGETTYYQWHIIYPISSDEYEKVIFNDDDTIETVTLTELPETPYP